MSDPKELRIKAKSDDVQNLEVSSHLEKDLDCPSPDPSIEATRAEIDNLTVSSHAERDPDWALNCRWEDWLAASEIQKELVERDQHSHDHDVSFLVGSSLVSRMVSHNMEPRKGSKRTSSRTDQGFSGQGKSESNEHPQMQKENIESPERSA